MKTAMEIDSEDVLELYTSFWGQPSNINVRAGILLPYHVLPMIFV